MLLNKYTFLKLSILFSNIQSFVPLTIIKGLLFTNIFIFLQVLYDLVFRPRLFVWIVFAFCVFFIMYSFWQLAVQFYYLATNPSYYSENLIFISNGDDLSFKLSLFTQSIYLFFCVIFFLYIYRYVLTEDNSLSKLIFLVKIGLIFYIGYGFFEWVMFILTGVNYDVLSNRITGEGFHYGLYQYISLGGMDLMRFKSLAGEPSMFAYTVVPFFILFYYLKDQFWIVLLLALVLSTSTTFILGILVFLVFDLLFIRRTFFLIMFFSFFVVVSALVFNEVLYSFIDFTLSKLTLTHESGSERFDNFIVHFNAWINSDLFHFIFGHGFGYVRSTDYLSSVLFNVGILGFLIITILFFYPIKSLLLNRDNLSYGLAGGLVSIYFMMMLSVSEFFYFHIWLFLAISWAFTLRKDKYAVCER